MLSTILEKKNELLETARTQGVIALPGIHKLAEQAGKLNKDGKISEEAFEYVYSSLDSAVLCLSIAYSREKA